MKKTKNNATEPITLEQVNALMAALGIEDKDIDTLEREQAEEDRRALEKWNKFVAEIMALR